MSNLNKKLLAEAFDAYVSEGDIAKATRLFQHHWNAKAKECFQLLESEDEEFDTTDLGDFNEEIADEAGSDKEEKFEQLQIAVDELEEKYPAEISEEVQGHFDELRNKIDEMKLAGEDDEVAFEDVAVIIEDLKTDFEAALNGELPEDVAGLFDEISSGLQGDEVPAEAEEIDADAESGEDAGEEAPAVEECGDKPLAEADEDSLDVDIDFDKPKAEEGEEATEEPVDDEPKAEDKGEDESDDLDIIYDAKESAKELLDKLDELEANEKAEEGSDDEEPVTEGFEKVKLPRNKLQNEEEGVKKEGMKFGKASSVSLNNKMNVAKTNSAGESADKKVKVEQAPQGNGVKSWTKVAKPENTKDAKSVLG